MNLIRAPGDEEPLRLVPRLAAREAHEAGEGGDGSVNRAGALGEEVPAVVLRVLPRRYLVGESVEALQAVLGHRPIGAVYDEGRVVLAKAVVPHDPDCRLLQHASLLVSAGEAVALVEAHHPRNLVRAFGLAVEVHGHLARPRLLGSRLRDGNALRRGELGGQAPLRHAENGFGGRRDLAGLAPDGIGEIPHESLA